MIRSFLKIGNRTLVVALEALTVVALLLAIAFGVFVWRVSSAPLSLGFAKEYVADALSGQVEGTTVTFDDIVMSWPELKGPFLLDLTGLRVQQGEGDINSLTIDKASVGLSRRSLLFGRIRPVSVIIREPALELVRGADGRLSMFVDQEKEPETYEEAIAADEQTDGGSSGEDVGQLFRDMATNNQSSFIGRLREFRIADASVAIRDHEFGLSWYLTDLDFTIREEAQGVAASLVVTLPGGKQGSANIALDMVYRKETDDFRAAGQVQDINPSIISRFLPMAEELGGQDLYFTGEIEAAMDSKMNPTYVKFDGSVPEGQINLPEEYDQPITLKDIKLSSEFKLSEKRLDISSLSGEIGGIPFTGSAQALLSEKSVQMPVKINVASVTREKIAAMFPKSELDGDAYLWVGKRIEGGTFSDVTLDMKLTADEVINPETNVAEWISDAPEMKLGFTFEGAKVTYQDTLMPATEAKGKGMLDIGAEVLDITEATGKIGDIQGSDISVKLTDFMESGSGFVTVKAHIKGPVATALSYIASEPIAMDEKEIGIDAKKAKGTIDADIVVALPTIKDLPKDKVEVSIEGDLTELNIPDVVEGLPLGGGPLHLKTEPGGFTIKGKAQLAGRATTIDWHQYFTTAGNPYSMKVTASIGADQELRNHFGVALDEYISGTMPVDVTYTSMGGGNATVDVKGDLNPVRIYISPFKFEKPVGVPGTITLNATLKEDVLKELKNIEVKSKDFSVSKATIGFAPMNGKKSDLAYGTLPDATIGRTQASADFKVTNNVMNVTAKASVFDLNPFLADDTRAAGTPQPPKEKQQPMKISLTADKMLAKNEQTVSSAKAAIDLDDEGDITRIEYDAAVGKGNLHVRFRPDVNGKRTFRLQTNDAGSVLHTFGVYDNIHGGTLLIYGEPKDGNTRGNLHGAMRMENFRVVKAPALASLLSLMSLTGISQLLNNDGLVFSKLESGFEWRFREAGNLLIIKDGKTSGSSIGLTFAGVLDRGKKTTDVAGTIIPMTEINSFLSKIPLVGEILGGAGGLIAATYSIKGPSNDPKIAVNPLSVLAPGIIRRILFEGGYESKIPDDPDTVPTEPKEKTAPEQVPPVTNKAKAGVNK